MRVVFDAYEWRARVFPAVIVSLPVVIALWSALLWKDITVGGGTASGLVSLAIIYALSTVVRSNGVRLQQELFKKWGAHPSTIVLRWRDKTLGNDLKAKYRRAVVSTLKLPIPTEREESENPADADKLIAQAFDRIRGVLRDEDADGLWATHNADYGFHRNLMGSRVLWLSVSVVGVLVSGILVYLQPTKTAASGLVANFGIVAGCLYMGWSTLPRGLEESAFQYALAAWESFLVLSKRGSS
ncbi:MAG: hypothetical protein DMG21_17505 [Acidobacteria bacterium]|nr:MAG: hypothetical protein DMG21_17505 [Acidobacteriota bacterium]